MTPDEYADLLARVVKAQSVGATILSNMSAAKRILEANPPTADRDDYDPDYPAGYGTPPYGEGPYGAPGYPETDPLTEG